MHATKLRKFLLNPFTIFIMVVFYFWTNNILITLSTQMSNFYYYNPSYYIILFRELIRLIQMVIYEEILYRDFMKRYIDSPIIRSIVFGLVHIQNILTYPDWKSISLQVLRTTLLGLYLELFDCIWYCIGFHILFNIIGNLYTF